MPAIAQVASWAFRPIPFLEACSRRFGASFTIHFPSYPPVVFTSDPEVIRDVFAGDPDALHAGAANGILKPLLGTGSVLLLDGPRHRRERKLLLPPFHGERMRAYAAAMRDAAGRAIDRWPHGRSFSAQTEMQRITLDVILRTVFGVDDGRRLERMSGPIVALLGFGAPAASLFMVGPRGEVRLQRIQGLLGPFGPYRRFRRLRSAVVALLGEEIERHRAAGDTARGDVLSLLLAARDEEGRGLSDEELVDEMMTLLVAGHETTATALSWTLYRLLREPGVVERAREEVRAGGEAEVGPYLDAVIRETLRLHPIVPMVLRLLRAPLRLGPLDLPAGVLVAPNIYLTHRRPDLWPEPQRFRPERFLATPPPRPHHFFPFGGGARTCLGMAFAYQEMREVLAEVLRSADVRLAPGYEARVVRRSIALAPSAGMPIRVH